MCYFCCSRSFLSHTQSLALHPAHTHMLVPFCRKKKCSCRNHFKCPPFVVCMQWKTPQHPCTSKRAKCASVTFVFRLDALAINVCCTRVEYKCRVAGFPCFLSVYPFASSGGIVFQRLHFLWNFQFVLYRRVWCASKYRQLNSQSLRARHVYVSLSLHPSLFLSLSVCVFVRLLHEHFERAQD